MRYSYRKNAIQVREKKVWLGFVKRVNFVEKRSWLCQRYRNSKKKKSTENDAQLLRYDDKTSWMKFLSAIFQIIFLAFLKLFIEPICWVNSYEINN